MSDAAPNRSFRHVADRIWRSVVGLAWIPSRTSAVYALVLMASSMATYRHPLSRHVAGADQPPAQIVALPLA
jgi:hypothetical protein